MAYKTIPVFMMQEHAFPDPGPLRLYVAANCARVDPRLVKLFEARTCENSPFGDLRALLLEICASSWS